MRGHYHKAVSCTVGDRTKCQMAKSKPHTPRTEPAAFVSVLFKSVTVVCYCNVSLWQNTHSQMEEASLVWLSAYNISEDDQVAQGGIHQLPGTDSTAGIPFSADSRAPRDLKLISIL